MRSTKSVLVRKAVFASAVLWAVSPRAFGEEPYQRPEIVPLAPRSVVDVYVAKPSAKETLAGDSHGGRACSAE
jgi:hypothetical protein